MKSVKAYMDTLSQRMDLLSQRERIWIFVVVFIIILFAAVRVVFMPLHAQQKTLQTRFNNTMKQVQIFDAEIERLVETSKKDPDDENREQLQRLKKQLGSMDASLQTFTTGLVSPREMASLVEQVLKQNTALHVRRVESLAPIILNKQDDTENQAASSTEQNVYQHGMRIELEGRYLDILKYLEQLEAMKWKVFWGKVALVSLEYPISRLSLVIHTLSLHEAWMGV